MHTLIQVRELLTNTAKNLRAILHEMNQIPAGCPVPPDMHRAILGELCTLTATEAELFGQRLEELGAVADSPALFVVGAPSAPDVVVRNISAADAPFVVAAPSAPAPEAPSAPEATPAAPGA